MTTQQNALASGLPRLQMEDYEACARLMFEAGVAIMVKGPPGIGKTKGLEAYARKRNEELKDAGGYAYAEINLANVNVADIQGYNIPVETVDTDWQGRPVAFQSSRMTYPFWAVDKFTGKPLYKFKHGVIVIEEYGQGGSDEKKSIQQLVEEHRIAGWHFEHFDMALLSNRDSDRAGVTKDFDHAINRRAEFELVPTLNALLVYAQKAHWSTMTMAFAARNEEILFNAKVPDKQGPWLTPRSLEKLDAEIQAAERLGLKLDNHLVLTAAAATVGAGNAGTYMAFVEARSKIPSVSAIVKDPLHTPVPSDLSIAMFLVFDLASKTTRENIKPICEYVRRMPSSFAVTYFHAVTNRDRTMVGTAEFSAFAMDNLDLLTAVAARKKQMGM